MRSPIRLAGHPVHPMLVHFPIVFWTGGVAADVGGFTTRHAWLWELSFGSYALGIATAAIAMLAGFLDYMSIPQGHPARDTAVSHMLVMVTAWLIFLVSVALRGLPPVAAPSVWAICVAIAGLGVTALGGWLGGRLVYRFGVGVQACEGRVN